MIEWLAYVCVCVAVVEYVSKFSKGNVVCKDKGSAISLLYTIFVLTQFPYP